MTTNLKFLVLDDDADTRFLNGHASCDQRGKPHQPSEASGRDRPGFCARMAAATFKTIPVHLFDEAEQRGFLLSAEAERQFGWSEDS
jgi:hypothetical protein